MNLETEFVRAVINFRSRCSKEFYIRVFKTPLTFRGEK